MPTRYNVTQQLDSEISQEELEQHLDTSSTPLMKSLGAEWLVRMSEYFINNPSIAVNGFLAAGIPQSIDACKPFVEDDDKPTDDELEIEKNSDENSEESDYDDDED